MTTEYIPPKVWTVDDQNGGAFASINRPVLVQRTKKPCL